MDTAVKRKGQSPCSRDAAPKSKACAVTASDHISLFHIRWWQSFRVVPVMGCSPSEDKYTSLPCLWLLNAAVHTPIPSPIQKTFQPRCDLSCDETYEWLILCQMFVALYLWICQNTEHRLTSERRQWAKMKINLVTHQITWCGPGPTRS